MKPAAVLLDLDGTLYEPFGAVPGATDAVARLRSAGVPLRFVTNTTRKPRSAVASHLQHMGFVANSHELLTAPAAAAQWLRQRNIRRVMPLLAEATLEDLEGLELVFDPHAPFAQPPEAVLVGDVAGDWSFEALNTAFRALREGAQLVACQKNRFWRDSDGFSLDAGAFVAALEYGASVHATVVGKPSAEFFATALAGIEAGAAETWMVGDDLEADIAGAKRAGLKACAVRTGKFREEDLAQAEVGPDLVLDSVAELPRALGL